MGQGWIGTAFLAEHADVYLDPIREGAEAAGRSLDDIEITVAAGLEFTDDTEAAGRRHAAGYAFTIGAMGSSKTNFYNQAYTRMGFGEAVEEVQRLWAAGDREQPAPPSQSRLGCTPTSSAATTTSPAAYGLTATPASTRSGWGSTSTRGHSMTWRV